MRAWLFGTLLGAVFVAVCGSCREDQVGWISQPECRPGQQERCECPPFGVPVSYRLCDGDGFWGPCDCRPSGTGGSGASTGTTTGTGSGTGGTRTGDPGPCSEPVDLGVGETPDCQDCIAVYCCVQYQTCASGGDCGPLVDCCTPGGLCEADCFYVICDSNLGYPLFRDCVDCLSANCCQVNKDCEADPDCLNCIAGVGSCDYNTLDEDVDNCTSGSCGAECNAGGSRGAAPGGSGGTGAQGR